MPVFTDQCGFIHNFESIPIRIVSLVPSQTELLCDLGLEENIVGITKFCVHPYHLKAVKTVVGGTKKVSYEKIKALTPDIIICNKEENTRDIVDSLQKVAPVWVTDIISIEDNNEMIGQFGEIFDMRNEASGLIEKIETAQREFLAFMESRKVLKSAYLIWKNPWMAAGGNTFINEMMKMNRLTNVFEDSGRYPESTDEKLEQCEAEIILLSSEPYPFKDADVSQMKNTAGARIILIDGEMFSWYGSRVLLAFDYFAQLQAKLIR